jgi:hypothetical protein
MRGRPCRVVHRIMATAIQFIFSLSFQYTLGNHFKEEIAFQGHLKPEHLIGKKLDGVN